MNSWIKLNFFTPLPPVPSDVANNAVTVALALQALADVTLWTPQEGAVTPVADLPIVAYDPATIPWARVNAADANIYNVGNNAPFHRGVFDIARRAPGLTILHDTRLQEMFARYIDTDPDHAAYYLDAMRRSHGLPGQDEARSMMVGRQSFLTLVEQFPMTLAALDGAVAAIVHNPVEAEALAQQTSVPVFHLPLAFAYQAERARLPRPPGATLRLVAFGYFGPNRRLESTLAAMAIAGDPAIEFDIYGVLAEPELILSIVRSHGLDGRVRLHGFVPEAELTAALDAADLAVNLRFPSMGEVSGSQLRIWDAALPSLVTRTGWYASLPPDVVHFVEPDREVETIAGHLRALRADPAPFIAAGICGRALLLARHSPADYAAGLIDIAARMPELHRRAQARTLAHSAARTLYELGKRDALTAAADPIAAAIQSLTSRPSPSASPRGRGPG